MSTTWDDIEKEICKYILDEWIETPIQWPNTNFDPIAELESADRSVWLSVNIIPTDDYQYTITGGNTGQLHKGILHLTLSIRKNKGTGLLTEYIDDARDLFNHHSITTNSNHTLQFDVPKPFRIGLDKGEYALRPAHMRPGKGQI